jgi:hypothetical protein
MTIHLVDRHIVTHTCSGNPEPHPVVTRQHIVHTTPGRSCLTPVTVQSGQSRAVVDCARRNPTDRQCPNCRTIITIRNVTTDHLGDQDSGHAHVTTSKALR